MSDTDTDSDIAEYLRENPRLMGVLFTLTLLLTQMGSAAASWGHTIT